MPDPASPKSHECKKKAFKEVELSSPHSWNLHKRARWNFGGHNFSIKKPQQAFCLSQLSQKNVQARNCGMLTTMLFIGHFR